ncbi:PREDICTED: BAG family molecular chaperone regulator 4 [Nanorana parkeri]|uniref:BAG family molecular chaperone regulator 4 n=1 Tax=Nanorana parkeri TaxID=125878 RepID=UPI00085458B3|nr:PREDICTED: BAG family molecular chaperone regulator 4 [Nanorana parkeri]
MSAAHRAGDGGGYYPGGEVLGRQRQEEGWGAGYYPPETGRSWPGGGEMGGAGGAQNSPYSGYDQSGWSCAGHPRPPYPPNYTVGGQGMEHYANGSYGPAYGQSTMNSPYPGVHPANPYYQPAPPPPPPPSQPQYAVDPYKQQGGAPQAPQHWGYPQQHPQYPQYPAPPGVPQQSPQNENWNMYGAHNPYQWHTAPPPPPPNPSSGHYMAGGRPSWTGGEVQPAVYDVKDPSQPPNYNHQRSFPGYPSNISQPGPTPEPKCNPPTPTAPPNPHYSASPQMYNRKDPSNQETTPRAKEANASPADPGIAKVNQILEKVAELEEEVDEFVGRKTDMSYRSLEELLTKQLLELDSIETGGQDSVRQARKEAVRKLQSILERLERKGL